RALREGVRRRDQGFYGRRRPVRAARGPRDRRRDRGEDARGVGAARDREARAARPDPGCGGGMSAVAARERLIQPHGGSLVDRLRERPANVDKLETITLTSREVSDLDMLASGALSPLEGFMGRDDYERVVDEMRLANGLPWALPVCLAVAAAPQGDRVALADESGRRLAVLEVEEVYPYDREREAERCFRTTETDHPGVARLMAQHPLYLSGRVSVFDRVPPAFPELARDPAETRALFAARGWKRVVGFQTRNPIHRAHEYLTKVALETVDGLLIHPLVGETKSDDVPAATRARARRSGTRSAGRTTAARTSSSGATTPASATTTAPTTRS